MVILLSTVEVWLLYGGIVLGTALLIGIIFFFAFGLRSKRKENTSEHVKVDEEFIETLLLGLGGADNIKTVSLDNGRVKFTLNDLDVLNYDAIKSISSTGAFITGNNLKLLFKYESGLIVDVLVKRGVNKC